MRHINTQKAIMYPITDRSSTHNTYSLGCRQNFYMLLDAICDLLVSRWDC